MSKAETIEEFYKRRYTWLPDNFDGSIGHFNVFSFKPFKGKHNKPVPYTRRDYYKITLLMGGSTIEYADKTIELKKQALVFTNPFIPYRWEHTENIHSGFYCIFDQAFFHQYGNLNRYSVFQPDGNHVLELTDDQVIALTNMFERMFEEIDSDYVHKYDVLRTIVYEIVHFALKTQPAEKLNRQENNASQRINSLFLELLERQFPIDAQHQSLMLRAPSEYAKQMNIHANYLNRAVKEITGKTTSQIIAERVLQEAKILLKQTTWSISEIAFALGFAEVPHFNNFFKKHLDLNPTKFRKV